MIRMPAPIIRKAINAWGKARPRPNRKTGSTRYYKIYWTGIGKSQPQIIDMYRRVGEPWIRQFIFLSSFCSFFYMGKIMKNPSAKALALHWPLPYLEENVGLPPPPKCQGFLCMLPRRGRRRNPGRSQTSKLRVHLYRTYILNKFTIISIRRERWTLDKMEPVWYAKGHKANEFSPTGPYSLKKPKIDGWAARGKDGWLALKSGPYHSTFKLTRLFSEGKKRLQATLEMLAWQRKNPAGVKAGRKDHKRLEKEETSTGWY